MAKKKASTKPELTEAEKALQQRVDAMMDPKRPDSPVTVAVASSQSEPLDIFAGHDVPDEAAASTAPEVPSTLLKEIGEKKARKSKTALPTIAELAAALERDEQAVAKHDPDDSIDSASTDEAVDEIVAQDSDDLLQVNPGPLTKPKSHNPHAPATHQPHNPANLTALIFLLVVLFIIAGLYFTHHAI